MRRARSWRWFRARVAGLLNAQPTWVVGQAKAIPIQRTRLARALAPDPD